MAVSTDVLHGEKLRLRRSSTAEQAADVVRSLILRRELEADAPLRETELAAALGVSRNTMREALRLLAREGLVAQQNHKVATVAPLRLYDVADIFAVRLVLERGAADLLAKRDQLPALTRMRESVEDLRHAGESGWQSVLDADRDFHVALVTLAGSPRLLAGYERLESEIQRCMSVTTRAHRDPDALYDQHAELLGYIEERRYEEFKAALGRHLAAAERNISRVVRGEEDLPSTPRRDPVGSRGEVQHEQLA
jgi:DNA-binding GntR family transcriptional regulator